MGKYYCIKQQDITDCGAACIATICRQYGLRTPISKIREIAGTDKQGTNVRGLILAAEQLGFSAKGFKGDINAISKNIPLPGIAHVIINDSLEHFVVIHKISPKGIIIADPERGIVKYTAEEFSKIWTGVVILMVPNPDLKKDFEVGGFFSRFFMYITHQKGLLIHLFIASLLYTLLGIGTSFYFKILLDTILPENLQQTLTIVSIGIICLFLFQALLGIYRSHLLLYLSQRLDIPIIFGYFQHVLKLPMNFFGTRKTGEIVSRFTDSANIREVISGVTLTIMIDTLMAVGGGIILYLQNSTMFLVAFIIILLYAILVFAFNKPIRKNNEKRMEENSQMISYMVESLNGIETIKAFNAERKITANTEYKFVHLLKTIFRGGVYDYISNHLSEAISLIGGVVILWVGAVNVINGTMSIGNLLTFNALLIYFLDPIKNLINLQPKLQTAIVASNRIGEIMSLEIEKTEKENSKIYPDTLAHNITFKDVNFRYGTRGLVLKKINLSIKKGEKIALVGESGSGKTTLVKLLMNFYQLESGAVTIGDYNINDINRDSLRDRISYISQDIFLFSGTIRENLLLGNENAAMEDIVKACQVSRADEFINKLHLRYDTMIEENGANLSGGQKQRLAIARALLRKPDLFIMDEATSNLDSITEKSIEKTINETIEGITTIIIAHRLSTIMKCDKIYVLHEGEIVESGTHHQLMNNHGNYYQLWKEQIPEPTESAGDHYE